jgi:FixJ family two-component response regulator
MGHHRPLVAIVDDDRPVGEATGELLEALGYSALIFTSAEEFLASYRVDDVACIISDVRMPGMGGIELQSKLISVGCRTPVILVTAFPEHEVRERALAAGAYAFLAKPFREEHLTKYLTSALQRSAEH